MEVQKREERRRLVRNTVGILLGGAMLNQWMKPICNSVVLPAHALTSMVTVPDSPPEDPQVTLPPLNTPPRGENVVIDAQYSLLVSYSMVPHLSDRESPATELTLSIDSLPEFGVIELLDKAVIVYELRPEFANAHGGSDHFNYHVIDPQGAQSRTYRVDIINFPYEDQ